MKTHSKRIVAVLLALITAMCLAVFSFADYQVAASLDSEKKTITVTNTDKTNYEYEISPMSADLFTSNTDEGNIVYSQLTPGTEYTISAFAKPRIDGATAVSTVKVKLLKSQNPPSAPTIVSSTATEIVVKYMTGCEVSLDNITYYQFANNTNYTFKGLTPEKSYVVYARKKATSEYYASAAVSSEIKTLKVGDKTVPVEAVLVDITNTTITVKKVAGYEYSLDKENWQSSNEFKNLKPNTVYTVYQRKTFDASEYEPSICSKGVQFQTTGRAPLKANPDAAEVVVPSKQHAGAQITVTAKTLFPAKDMALVYGDTKITPAYLYTEKDSAPVSFKATEKDKNVFEAKFKPSDDADGSYNFYIVFKSEKYDGKGNWVDDGTEVRTVAVKILPKQNWFEKFVEGLGNVLFNYLPSALTKVGKAFVTVITWFVKILGSIK
ncbi:MAG: hypothetical protein K6B52_02430 [Clostridiales bacterium]|nr:hypothetical protein [Clostridiales bacterium]